MFADMKRLVSRFWLSGLIVVIIHSGAFKVCEIFGWPSGSLLDYFDGPGFQFVNSVVLLSHPPIYWHMIRDFNEQMDFASWAASLVLISFVWFLVGISIPALWPFGKSTNQRHRRQLAIRILGLLIALVGGWYAIVFANTYWGTITSIGRHYLNCGSIEHVQLPHSISAAGREVQKSEFDQIMSENLTSRQKFQAAFADRRNAKLLVRSEQGRDELFLECKRQRCELRIQTISLIEQPLRDLDMRGWGRTRNMSGVKAIDMLDGKTAIQNNDFERWTPIVKSQRFLAITTQGGRTLTF